MQKFTEIKRGSFVRDSTEYTYALEIAENFPTKGKNVRLRIISEAPALHSVETRYDPNISMEGDADAFMDVLLGYDVKGLKKKIWCYILVIMTFPIVAISIAAALLIPKDAIVLPAWVDWIFLGVFAVLFFKTYLRAFPTALAEYFKAKDVLKRVKEHGKP